MPYRQVGLICPSDCVHFLVDYLKKLQFDVRALWTPEPELTIHAAAEFEIPFSASRPDEVLLKKEVQMIIITGRPQIHAQIAVKALGIGKHVLCDAPVTLNCSEAVKMVQAAQYYPQLLALVGYGLRHARVFRKAKELIRSGYVGNLVACECSVKTGPLLLADRYNWLWESSMGGGVLNLVGCHIIDIISYLTQRRASRVQGLVKCSGLAAAGASGYPMEKNGDHVAWMNGDSNFVAAKVDSDAQSSNSSCGGFRRVNADDFASFLLKFDQDFVATVTLNALSEPITSAVVSETKSNTDDPSSIAGPSSSAQFSHRILISGTEGHLEISDHEIRCTKFRSTLANGNEECGLVSNECFSSESCYGQLLHQGGEKSPSNSGLVHSVLPSIYANGFLDLLRLLSDALPAYEQQHRRSGSQSKKLSLTDGPNSWQTGSLASMASFEDAQYVRAVIDAVRHSSEKGDWVKIDLPQHVHAGRWRFDQK